MSHEYIAKYPHRHIMYKTKLTSNNFPEWYKNLRNVLEKENRLYVLDHSFPIAPPEMDLKEHWLKHHHDSHKVSYLILSSISDDYPSGFRTEIQYLPAYDMIKAIQGKFLSEKNWRFAILKEITKPMKFHHSIKDHVERFVGYMDRLEKLGYPMKLDIRIDTILISLPAEYDLVVKEYNNSGRGGTMAELKELLISAEERLKATNGPGSSIDSPRGIKRDLHPFDEICFHCGKEGHQNCTGKYSRLVGSSSRSGARDGLVWEDLELEDDDDY